MSAMSACSCPAVGGKVFAAMYYCYSVINANIYEDNLSLRIDIGAVGQFPFSCHIILQDGQQ